MKTFLGMILSLFVAFSVQAKTYKIERSEKNVVSWTAIGNPGFLKIDGEGGFVEGVAYVEDGKAWGTFECDLTLFKTGIETRDEHMHESYLHTKKHPKAKFVLKKHELAPEFAFKGELTLHGVTKEVSGKAKMKKVGEGYWFAAKMTVALTDFNIEVPSYLGVTVAKDVDIEVKAVL